MNKSKNQQILSGGQAIVETLKIEGVKYVFGLIGSATMELFDALYDTKDIKFIDVRDERTGAHMADGYARASGKAGIVIAGQNGPGATNLVTGIAQANAAFSPVISLAGDIASEHKGKDGFQEIDQQALFGPITKKTFSVKQTEEIPKILNEVFDLALTPRCGPVHVNLPRDILANNANFAEFHKHQNNILPKASKNQLTKTIDIILSSSKPVIIAGGGIKNTQGGQEVLRLAKILNIPIVSSAGHGDVLPFDESLYAGQMGPRGNLIASDLVKKADVILALGTRLGFNSTFFSYENINKQASIIQVDIDPKSLARYFPITIGICADAKTVAIELYNEILLKNEVVKIDSWTKIFIDKRKAYLKTRDTEADFNSHLIQPSGLFKILRETLPKNSAVTLDAGTLCLQATDMLNFYLPRTLFTPLDFGLVGFSFACGLGVKLAKPDCPVISLMGDGGFGMTISELSTAVQHKINTVTIVMNNKSWGAEKAYQRDFYEKRYIGANIDSPPFDKVAELYGAAGFHVNKISELKDAINAALQCEKPAVINVDVDPNALYSFRKDSFKHKQKS
ncbi:thiamine pyrophosphate-binding protein [Alphaproteobacteria bacterium]|nr:thiamine pyrophosphate-binding protein [Alphaproteobacteria bacterium]